MWNLAALKYTHPPRVILLFQFSLPRECNKQHFLLRPLRLKSTFFWQLEKTKGLEDWARKAFFYYCCTTKSPSKMVFLLGLWGVTNLNAQPTFREWVGRTVHEYTQCVLQNKFYHVMAKVHKYQRKENHSPPHKGFFWIASSIKVVKKTSSSGPEKNGNLIFLTLLGR